MTEQELASHVVAYLEAHQWHVLQEVRMGDRTIDIVARRGQTTWAIETKLSPSLAVLAQAVSIIGAAHRVSIAVPYTPSNYGPMCAVCQALNIGALVWHKHEGVVEAVSPSSRAPHPMRRMGPEIQAREIDAHGQAGAQHGRAKEQVPKDVQDGSSLDFVLSTVYGAEVTWQNRAQWEKRLLAQYGGSVKGHGKRKTWHRN